MTSFIPSFIEMNKNMAEMSGRKLPRFKRPTIQQPPKGVERTMAAALAGIIDAINADIRELLLPELPRLVRAAQLRDDGLHEDVARRGLRTDIEDVTAIVRTILGSVEVRMNNRHLRNLEELVQGYFNDTSKFSRQQTFRQIRRAIGVDVFPREAQLQQLLTAFTEENVAKFSEFTRGHITEIGSIARRGVIAGDRPGLIQTNLLKRFEVSRNRARLIARDQVNKLNGSLTRMRQKSLGIDEYIWRTSRDERVRASHLELEGRKFSWDDPPAIGHPGQPILCRCSAEPVIEGVPERKENRREVIREVQEKKAKQKERERLKRERTAKGVGRGRVARGSREEIGNPFRRSLAKGRPADETQGRVFDSVDAWVHGSRSRSAIVMKQAAKAELGGQLGLNGVAFTGRNFDIRPDEVSSARRTMRTMYDQTQEQLKRQGVESIKLFRGVKADYDHPGVLESWTTDRKIAKKFAGSGGEVFVADIPRKRILNGVTLDHWHNGAFGAQAEWVVMQ